MSSRPRGRASLPGRGRLQSPGDSRTSRSGSESSPKGRKPKSGRASSSSPAVKGLRGSSKDSLPKSELSLPSTNDVASSSTSVDQPPKIKRGPGRPRTKSLVQPVPVDVGHKVGRSRAHSMVARDVTKLSKARKSPERSRARLSSPRSLKSKTLSSDKQETKSKASLERQKKARESVFDFDDDAVSISALSPLKKKLKKRTLSTKKADGDKEDTPGAEELKSPKAKAKGRGKPPGTKPEKKTPVLDKKSTKQKPTEVKSPASQTGSGAESVISPRSRKFKQNIKTNTFAKDDSMPTLIKSPRQVKPRTGVAEQETMPVLTELSQSPKPQTEPVSKEVPKQKQANVTITQDSEKLNLSSLKKSAGAISKAVASLPAKDKKGKELLKKKEPLDSNSQEDDTTDCMSSSPLVTPPNLHTDQTASCGDDSESLCSSGGSGLAVMNVLRNTIALRKQLAKEKQSREFKSDSEAEEPVRHLFSGAEVEASMSDVDSTRSTGSPRLNVFEQYSFTGSKSPEVDKTRDELIRSFQGSRPSQAKARLPLLKGHKDSDTDSVASGSNLTSKGAAQDPPLSRDPTDDFGEESSATDTTDVSTKKATLKKRPAYKVKTSSFSKIKTHSLSQPTKEMDQPKKRGRGRPSKKKKTPIVKEISAEQDAEDIAKHKKGWWLKLRRQQKKELESKTGKKLPPSAWRKLMRSPSVPEGLEGYSAPRPSTSEEEKLEPQPSTSEEEKLLPKPSTSAEEKPQEKPKAKPLTPKQRRQIPKRLKWSKKKKRGGLLISVGTKTPEKKIAKSEVVSDVKTKLEVEDVVPKKDGLKKISDSEKQAQSSPRERLSQKGATLSKVKKPRQTLTKAKARKAVKELVASKRKKAGRPRKDQPESLQVEEVDDRSGNLNAPRKEQTPNPEPLELHLSSSSCDGESGRESMEKTTAEMSSTAKLTDGKPSREAAKRGRGRGRGGKHRTPPGAKPHPAKSLSPRRTCQDDVLEKMFISPTEGFSPPPSSVDTPGAPSVASLQGSEKDTTDGTEMADLKSQPTDEKKGSRLSTQEKQKPKRRRGRPPKSRKNSLQQARKETQPFEEDTAEAVGTGCETTASVSSKKEPESEVESGETRLTRTESKTTAETKEDRTTVILKPMELEETVAQVSDLQEQEEMIEQASTGKEREEPAKAPAKSREETVEKPSVPEAPNVTEPSDDTGANSDESNIAKSVTECVTEICEVTERESVSNQLKDVESVAGETNAAEDVLESVAEKLGDVGVEAEKQEMPESTIVSTEAVVTEAPLSIKKDMSNRTEESELNETHISAESLEQQKESEVTETSIVSETNDISKEQETEDMELGKPATNEADTAPGSVCDRLSDNVGGTGVSKMAALSNESTAPDLTSKPEVLVQEAVVVKPEDADENVVSIVLETIIASVTEKAEQGKGTLVSGSRSAEEESKQVDESLVSAEDTKGDGDVISGDQKAMAQKSDSDRLNTEAQVGEAEDGGVVSETALVSASTQPAPKVPSEKDATAEDKDPSLGEGTPIPTATPAKSLQTESDAELKADLKEVNSKLKEEKVEVTVVSVIEQPDKMNLPETPNTAVTDVSKEETESENKGENQSLTQGASTSKSNKDQKAGVETPEVITESGTSQVDEQKALKANSGEESAIDDTNEIKDKSNEIKDKLDSNEHLPKMVSDVDQQSLCLKDQSTAKDNPSDLSLESTELQESSFAISDLSTAGEGDLSLLQPSESTSDSSSQVQKMARGKRRHWLVLLNDVDGPPSKYNRKRKMQPSPERGEDQPRELGTEHPREDVQQEEKLYSPDGHLRKIRKLPGKRRKKYKRNPWYKRRQAGSPQFSAAQFIAEMATGGEAGGDQTMPGSVPPLRMIIKRAKRKYAPRVKKEMIGPSGEGHLLQRKQGGLASLPEGPSSESDTGGPKMATRGKKNRYWYLFAKKQKGRDQNLLSKPAGAEYPLSPKKRIFPYSPEQRRKRLHIGCTAEDYANKTQEELKAMCVPCSVVLIDFIKCLDLMNEPSGSAKQPMLPFNLAVGSRRGRGLGLGRGGRGRGRGRGQDKGQGRGRGVPKAIRGGKRSSSETLPVVGGKRRRKAATLRDDFVYEGTPGSLYNRDLFQSLDVATRKQLPQTAQPAKSPKSPTSVTIAKSPKQGDLKMSFKTSSVTSMVTQEKPKAVKKRKSLDGKGSHTITQYLKSPPLVQDSKNTDFNATTNSPNIGSQFLTGAQDKAKESLASFSSLPSATQELSQPQPGLKGSKKTARKQIGVSVHLKFHCLHCSYATQSRPTMQEHIYNHTDVVPYCCGHCGAIFGTVSGVKVHSKREHQGMRPNVVKTSSIIEEDYYTRTEDYERLYASRDGRTRMRSPKKPKSSKTLLSVVNKDPMLACRFCSFQHNRREVMENHCHLRHSTELRLICPLCVGIRFKFAESMKRHFRHAHPKDLIMLQYEAGYTVFKSDKSSTSSAPKTLSPPPKATKPKKAPRPGTIAAKLAAAETPQNATPVKGKRKSTARKSPSAAKSYKEYRKVLPSLAPKLPAAPDGTQPLILKVPSFVPNPAGGQVPFFIPLMPVTSQGEQHPSLVAAITSPPPPPDPTPEEPEWQPIIGTPISLAPGANNDEDGEANPLAEIASSVVFPEGQIEESTSKPDNVQVVSTAPTRAPELTTAKTQDTGPVPKYPNLIGQPAVAMQQEDKTTSQDVTTGEASDIQSSPLQSSERPADVNKDARSPCPSAERTGPLSTSMDTTDPTNAETDGGQSRQASDEVSETQPSASADDEHVPARLDGVPDKGGDAAESQKEDSKTAPSEDVVKDGSVEAGESKSDSVALVGQVQMNSGVIPEKPAGKDSVGEGDAQEVTGRVETENEETANPVRGDRDRSEARQVEEDGVQKELPKEIGTTDETETAASLQGAGLEAESNHAEKDSAPPTGDFSGDVQLKETSSRTNSSQAVDKDSAHQGMDISTEEDLEVATRPGPETDESRPNNSATKELPDSGAKGAAEKPTNENQKSSSAKGQEYMCKEVSSTSDEPRDTSGKDSAESVPENANIPATVIEAQKGDTQDDSSLKIVSICSLASSGTGGTKQTELQVFQCQLCSLKPFRSFRAAILHISSMHNVLNPGFHACPYCGFRPGGASDNMLRHIETAHPDEDKLQPQPSFKDSFFKLVTVKDDLAAKETHKRTSPSPAESVPSIPRVPEQDDIVFVPGPMRRKKPDRPIGPVRPTIAGNPVGPELPTTAATQGLVLPGPPIGTAAPFSQSLSQGVAALEQSSRLLDSGRLAHAHSGVITAHSSSLASMGHVPSTRQQPVSGQTLQQEQDGIVRKPPPIMPARLMAPRAALSPDGTVGATSTTGSNFQRCPPPLIPMGPMSGNEKKSSGVVTHQGRAPLPAHSHSSSATHVRTPMTGTVRPLMVTPRTAVSRMEDDDDNEDEEEVPREAFSVFNIGPRLRNPGQIPRLVIPRPPQPMQPSQLIGAPQPDAAKWRQFQARRPAPPMIQPPRSMYPGTVAMDMQHGMHPAFLRTPMDNRLRGGPPNINVRDMVPAHMPPAGSQPMVPQPRRLPDGSRPCPYCQFSAHDIDTLHSHILTHEPNIHWTCPYCPMTTKMTKAFVEKHINNAHPGKRIVYIPYGVKL